MTAAITTSTCPFRSLRAAPLWNGGGKRVALGQGLVHTGKDGCGKREEEGGKDGAEFQIGNRLGTTPVVFVKSAQVIEIEGDEFPGSAKE